MAADPIADLSSALQAAARELAPPDKTVPPAKPRPRL